MEDYKANSHKAKAEEKSEEKKEITKVVNGRVTAKKKSGIDKVKNTFISEDAQNIKSYVLMDVLVPAVKKAVSDIVTNGIDMILYGETGRTKKKSSIANYVSYRSYSDRDRRDEGRYSDVRSRSYSYDDIILESRREAEEVLNRMNEIIDTYGVVSVGDLYDLVGVTGSYTDNKYGWSNIRNAEPVRVRDGYMLKLPKALAID